MDPGSANASRGSRVYFLFLSGLRNDAISIDDVGLLLPTLLILGIMTTVLIGVLAASYPSRKRWVRIAALVVEGLIILDEGYGIVSDFQPPRPA